VHLIAQAFPFNAQDPTLSLCTIRTPPDASARRCFTPVPQQSLSKHSKTYRVPEQPTLCRPLHINTSEVIRTYLPHVHQCCLTPVPHRQRTAAVQPTQTIHGRATPWWSKSTPTYPAHIGAASHQYHTSPSNVMANRCLARLALPSRHVFQLFAAHLPHVHQCCLIPVSHRQRAAAVQLTN
jgi:hypothetical protein